MSPAETWLLIAVLIMLTLQVCILLLVKTLFDELISGIRDRVRRASRILDDAIFLDPKKSFCRDFGNAQRKAVIHARYQLTPPEFRGQLQDWLMELGEEEPKS
jgi:hypothetical protein